MRLLTAHKILIATAVGLGLLLTIRSLALYAANRAKGELVYALGELVLTLALGLYLRALWRR
jgi:hypothetical protein